MKPPREQLEENGADLVRRASKSALHVPLIAGSKMVSRTSAALTACCLLLGTGRSWWTTSCEVSQ